MELMRVVMPEMKMWTASGLIDLWAMWSVMMVAMMLPSMSPPVLIFAAIEHQRGAPPRAVSRTGLFMAGYVLAWAGFSVFATLAQWLLHSAALLSPMMISTNVRLSGAILILAGAFQWAPFKNRCLRHCRSPLGFLLTEWRKGPLGSLVMGLRYGAYCVGCCWLLMTLLFALGIMNLLWIAALAAFVLAERGLPFGRQIGLAGGTVLFVFGAWMLFHGA
jgi:predicted metal-binding membrane protein